MASVKGIYFSLSESELLSMRTATLAELERARTGKRFQSVGTNGKSFTKDNMSVPQLREELQEITAALQRVNPTTYGRRVRRVSADFRDA